MERLSHFDREVREISRTNIEGMVVVGSLLDHFLENNEDPEDLFSHNVQLLKSDDSIRNALIRLSDAKLEVKPKEIFVKEFRSKNTLHALKPCFTRHRAQIAWQISCHFLNNGVPVPEPEGYLLKKSGPFYGKGYFFSKVLSDCNSLGTLAWNSKELSKRLAFGGLVEALARGIAALHDCGVTHGDLKWPNILVHDKDNRLWFVDLDSAKLHTHFLGPTRVARDLARFVLYGFQTETSNAIINRFLDEYCRQRKLDRGSIEARMAKMLKKLRKRHKSIPEDRIKEVLKNY
jgi:Lipopolysaccharide kinase (Kdo/WaaP) family